VKPCCEQENRALKTQMAHLRVRDPLTGLYNRQHFMRLLKAELETERPALVKALIYIRPDQFSSIDARYGPEDSDALLKRLAEEIEKSCDRNSVAARFGGNVFTLLVLSSSMDEVNTRCQQLIDNIGKKVFNPGGQATIVTLSVGVVELRSGIDNSNRAFLLAQAANQQARAAGGGQVCIDNTQADDHDAAENQDGIWLKRIRRALQQDQFQLVYQPIANLGDDANNCQDVLLRLQNDSGEAIAPAEFLPAAQRGGLMPEIDRWVISAAFAKSAQRESESKPAQMFLRLSEDTLLDDEFEAWLGHHYGDSRLVDNAIILQINEDDAARNAGRLRSLSDLCQALGMGIAISHFGVAPNCMQILELIPLSYVIIDGLFLGNLNDEERLKQLEVIVTSAHEQAIPVIASQVENARELAVLCSIGIDYVLGYIVQEPDAMMPDQAVDLAT
jgi:diguanylate cyclase (GGDEF)-like protein